MKKIILFLFVAIIFIACKGKKSNTTNKPNASTEVTTTNSADKPAILYAVENIIGSYVGAFGDNKITLLITKALNDTLHGRTIVGGNDRPFQGTYSEKDGIFTVTAKEPGDHPNDGSFSFAVKGDSTSNLTGSWTPNDKKKPAKEYSLERKKFTYNANIGDYPQASQRLLKTADVENLMRGELEQMRNEIFARHGFCFKKKEMRQQFETADWYVPNTVDIKGFLTDIEKKNIELIKRYEKYAEEYGDEYGR